MTRYSISNGEGESIDSPSRDEMRRFLFAIDADDIEHGAAWLSTDSGHSLEWNGDGRLVFSTPEQRSRHLLDISRERALELWLALADSKVADVERLAWRPGHGIVKTEAQLAREREWALQAARAFYDSLGSERTDTRCAAPGCTRGTIELSVHCRTHHYEAIRRAPCPFRD